MLKQSAIELNETLKLHLIYLSLVCRIRNLVGPHEPDLRDH